MMKRMSHAEITPIPTTKAYFKPSPKQVRPSQFLNDIESVPSNFMGQYEFEEVVDYKYPLTARRRVALGSNTEGLKKELTLPTLENISINGSSNQSLYCSVLDLKQSQSTRTGQSESKEMENMNRKIKKIINSNRRQVTFQSSLVVIDEKNKISLLEAPYIQKDPLPGRRQTMFRKQTLEM